MKTNRTKNAVRNIVWGVVEKIVSLLLPFVIRTMMIKTIGAEYLGLSSLFTSILSVLSISELGIGSAIVFSMYRPIAEDDEDTICALLNVYRKIYHVIGTVILVAGTAIVPFLPKLVSGDLPPDVNLYVLYAIFLFSTVISYYLWAYKAALFSAHQRNDLASKRTITINLIGNVLKIIALAFFKNFYAYIIVLPITTIATNIANAMLAKKVYPTLVCRGDISQKMKSSMKKRVIGLLSFKIYNVIFSSVDSIVISAFLGLKMLAIYNNYYYIQTSIIGFLVIITSSITAGIGSKMVTNSVDDNYADFKKLIFANAWLVSWCSICMAVLYQPFMRLWVGEELTFSTDTMLLMVLYFLIPRITALTYTYREAAGLWWEDRFRPLVAAAVNLIANLILVRIIGMNGVIISTLICSVGINIPWGSIILFKNYFKRSPAEYFRNIIFYVAATALVGLVTYIICRLVPGEGFIGLIADGLICVIVPNIGLWLVYHRLDEYKSAVELAQNMLQKFTKR